MPRIEFDGKGDLIPSLALPPVGGDDTIAPTVLTFAENADFSVADYRALGFTHFEAWCVGAAGGRGGDSASQLLWESETVNKPVPQSVWNLVRERAMYDDWLEQATFAFTDPQYTVPQTLNLQYYPGDFQGPPGTIGWYTDFPNHVSPNGLWLRWSMLMGSHGFRFFEDNQNLMGPPASPYLNYRGTYVDMFEMANPNHLMTFRTFKQALLVPSIEAMGGGGGGGGLQKAAGALADLPDVVPIVIGKAGADFGFGQVIRNGVYTPELVDIDSQYYRHASLNDHLGNPLPWPYRRINEIKNYLLDYLTSYPDPHASFPNPQKGQDGGASSFAGVVCQASGGAGGEPGMVWDAPTNLFKLKGSGGAGGLGGRSDAGGGGAGSMADGANGADGVWLPETGVGAGGGGGKGGSPPTGGTPGDPRFLYNNPRFYGTPGIRHDATAGGQGSFSYADTSVYGQRQFRPSVAIPGGGGGARPTTNLKVGSRASGYSPDGVVVIRLVKIT